MITVNTKVSAPATDAERPVAASAQPRAGGSGSRGAGAAVAAAFWLLSFGARGSAAQPTFDNCKQPNTSTGGGFSFSVSGSTGTRDSPCVRSGTTNSVAVAGKKYLFACGTEGAVLCDGDGSGPKPASCSNVGMLGCSTARPVWDVAFNTGADAVFAACFDAVMRCEWDAAAGVTPGTCKTVTGAKCPSAGEERGVAFSGSDLVLGCSSPTVAEAGVHICPLAAGGTALRSQCYTTAAWEKPCKVAGQNNWMYHAMSLSLFTTGIGVGCGDGASYCATFSAASGPGGCTAPFPHSPCPQPGTTPQEGTQGFAELPSGRTMVSCGWDGIYLCGSTGSPTAAPSVPSVRPSAGTGTPAPTALPSANNSTAPSWSPASGPSLQPSQARTPRPSQLPSDTPSTGPTPQPSTPPTSSPQSTAPSSSPSAGPRPSPTRSPTTNTPTRRPSTGPRGSPSASPSAAPSTGPAAAPTQPPTVAPPSASPSSRPSAAPSAGPAAAPTEAPAAAPTPPPSQPVVTASPSLGPSRSPSTSPLAAPTVPPTSSPVTPAPTSAPTGGPRRTPTPTTAPPSTAPPTSSPTKRKSITDRQAGTEIIGNNPTSSGVTAAAGVAGGAAGVSQVTMAFDTECNKIGPLTKMSRALHPTQWAPYDSPYFGCLLGAAAIVSCVALLSNIAVWILQRYDENADGVLSKEEVQQTCLRHVPVIKNADNVDIGALARHPNTILTATIFVYQGASFSSLRMLVGGEQELWARVVGLFVSPILLAFPFWVRHKVWRGVTPLPPVLGGPDAPCRPLARVRKWDLPRPPIAVQYAFLSEQGDWVSCNRERHWVSSWQTAVRPYVAHRAAEAVFVELFAMWVLALVNAPATPTRTRCGHVRLFGAVVHIAQLAHCCARCPYRCVRDTAVQIVRLVALIAALLVLAVGFYADSRHDDAVGALLQAATFAALVRVVLNLAAEALLLAKGWRANSQALEWSRGELEESEGPAGTELEARLLPPKSLGPPTDALLSTEALAPQPPRSPQLGPRRALAAGIGPRAAAPFLPLQLGPSSPPAFTVTKATE
eukprot:TRINITY_DN3931_c0_g2_i3.p1 TRINITY_DN3931_c0_g2~~TRINITY_DN3931_c0_g2_i3.p1  ORF type:complete len:1055 (+),score=190.06 TRINITY_DN3931_c0_g2_i3:104-3268(+)